jgi:hypothetical protein
MVQQEVYSGQMVDSLRHSLRDGKHGLSLVPMLIKRVIEGDMWRDFVVERTGERVTYTRFIDFVTTKPLEGLGADLKLIKRICADHKDVLLLIAIELEGKPGNPTGANQYQSGMRDNIMHSKPQYGTDRSYALRRLHKDRPDLLQKVIAGNLTPHGAMVEAGFRPKTFTITQNVERAAKTIIKAGGEGFARELIDELKARLREGGKQ